MNIFKTIGRAFIPVTERQARDLGTIIAVAIALLAVLGIRAAQHDDPPQAPRTVETTPDPRLEVAGASAATAYVRTPYVAVKESCRTPGHGRVAYCWFEGWQFSRKTICIDSSISGAPLAALARHYTGIGGIRVVVGGTRAGACAAGYDASQRVSFLSMSKTGAARYGYNVCGLTQAANYGALSSVAISVYVTGAQRTPCGAGVEWGDVFEHEFGHALGLSHEQRYASSVMRDADGRGPDATDKAELTILYGAKKA